MLWLALYCPTLSLDCILRRWPEGLDPALAVTDLVGSKRLIAVATRRAQSCGVFAGQSVATALSLLPDLVLIARKLEDERVALTEAALAALRFTPIVSLRSTGLLMEISASLKLFGGRRALRRSLADAMRVQGLRVAAAEAPTPHGAWLLAQERARKAALRTQAPNRSRKANAGDGADSGADSGAGGEASAPLPPETFHDRLAALPIAHLESCRPWLKRLDGIGIETFGDLRRLPVKGLARRFGTALIDELARAAGDRPDPQVVYEAPSRFDLRIELMAQVETAEALVFASRRLLAQMTGWLTARRGAVRGFTLTLHHDRWTRDAIAPTVVAIALTTPSSDLSRLGMLVRERFSRIELKAPVLELSLEAPAIVDEQEAHGTLFPEREPATETLGRLLEKLTARLGPDAMTRLERVADHRPERAWREIRGGELERRTPAAMVPAARAAGQAKQPLGQRGLAMGRAPGRSIDASETNPTSNDSVDWMTAGCACGPRPVWLLAHPQQLEVRSHKPWFEAMPLELVAGPERIETGWWDDAPATRDYFIGENAVGRLVWIYRERLPVASHALWYLQGLFG